MPLAWVILAFSCLLGPKRPPVFPRRGSGGSLQEPKPLVLLPRSVCFVGSVGSSGSCEQPAGPRTAHPPVAGLLLVCPLCLLPSSPSASWLVLTSTGHAPTSGFSLCPLSSSLPRCHLSETFRNLTTLLKIAVHTPPLVCPILIRFIFLYSIYHVLTHCIIALLFYCLSPLSGISVPFICFVS